jgi:hypothetical protein
MTTTQQVSAEKPNTNWCQQKGDFRQCFEHPKECRDAVDETTTRGYERESTDS